MVLCENFSGVVIAAFLVNGSKDVASLVACTRKKFFGWRMRILCEWCHKWRTFRPPSPSLPGPVLKPFDGSDLLKFLL